MGMRSAILAGAIAVSAMAGADEVDVPYTFEAGDTARASEMNANFSAVEAAINDNAHEIQENAASIGANTPAIQSNLAGIAANTSAIGDLQSGLERTRLGIGVLVDGSEVGRLLGSIPRTLVLDLGAVLGVSPPGAAVITYVAGGGIEVASAIEVISDSGYLFQLSTSLDHGPAFPQGALLWRNIWYDQASCQGVAYWKLESLQVAGPPKPGLAQQQGVVFASPDSQITASKAYYVPSGAEPEAVSLSSLLTISTDTLEPTCEDILFLRPEMISPSSSSVIKLLPNDPDVTRVSAYAGGALELQ